MAVIQDLVLTFCPTMHSAQQKNLKLLMPVFTFKWYGNTWNKTFYSQRIWFGYNIELAELVYDTSSKTVLIWSVALGNVLGLTRSLSAKNT